MQNARFKIDDKNLVVLSSYKKKYVALIEQHTFLLSVSTA